MSVEVKHLFHSAKGDGGDTTLVQPGDWNALHVFSMTGANLLGRVDSGAGPAVEIPLGAGLGFKDGALTSLVSALPVGLVVPLAANYEPPGWLICDGRLISTSTYSGLHSALGFKFGGTLESGMFGIPDMRGRVPAGKDNLGGTAANRLTPATIPGGATDVGSTKVAGTERHILLATELPAISPYTVSPDTHKHFLVNSGNANTAAPDITSTRSIYARNTGAGDNSYHVSGDDADDFPANQGLSSEDTHTHTLTSTGADQPHMNLQPTIIMNYIIWTAYIP